MIHVCFALNDAMGRYSKFVGTATLSIFDNTKSDVTIHILHDNTLTPDNRDKFILVAKRYRQRVKFYNVAEICAERLETLRSALSETFKAQYSDAAIYRFLIPQIFSTNIDKIIYLDADIIVNMDIAELWCIKLDDKPLAALPVFMQNADKQTGLNRAKKMFALCRDGLIAADDYFNSGVLLMNLNAFRAEAATVTDGIKFIAAHPEYKFFDQDVLNYCFASRAVKLPVKFNRGVRYERLEGDGKLAKKIYHYVGQNPAWSFGLDMNDVFNRLWMEYFLKSPWFDVDSIGRLYAGVERLHVGLKSAMANVSAIVSGKTRAFFTLPENVEATRELFTVKADEEIILATSEASIKKLLDAMQQACSKKVFFIMMQGFPFDVLTRAGFVQNQDFLDGWEFLSEAQGVPLNSHQILKAM